MEEKQVKIKLSGQDKTVLLGKINMGIRMKALKESTELIPYGKTLTNRTDYVKAEVLEMIYSQIGENKITYADYLKLHPNEGGDELIVAYRSLNYGGGPERDSFQENNMG